MKKLALLLALLLLAGCSAPQEAAAPVENVPDIVPLPEEHILPPDPAEELLAAMTVEEKVGQMFLAYGNPRTAVEDIRNYHLGGLVLFADSFEGQTPDTVCAATAAYQEAADIPLLISVDEEGGIVCRISSYSAFRASRFPSARNAYNSGGMAAVRANEEEICELLTSLGLNVNLGPVCDVTTDPNVFMYKRSLGQDAATVGEFVTDTVEIMDAYQVGSVLKHFPGYGNNADTHQGSALDKRSLQELEAVDLVPFRYGIDAGCGGILVSHTVVAALDDVWPASLSGPVHDYLRNEMGFEGVIITDDLRMKAIADNYDDGQVAVMAVLAGNDMLCSAKYATQYPAVVEAVESGDIPMDVIDEAVLRVLRWKISLGLL